MPRKPCLRTVVSQTRPKKEGQDPRIPALFYFEFSRRPLLRPSEKGVESFSSAFASPRTKEWGCSGLSCESARASYDPYRDFSDSLSGRCVNGEEYGPNPRNPPLPPRLETRNAMGFRTGSKPSAQTNYNAPRRSGKGEH